MDEPRVTEEFRCEVLEKLRELQAKFGEPTEADLRELSSILGEPPWHRKSDGSKSRALGKEGATQV